MNRFEGTWIANLSKSQRHLKHLFQSAALRFEISGNAVSLTHSGVNMEGKQETGTQTLHPDGKEYAVVPENPDIVVTARWLGKHALEIVAKKKGDVIGHASYRISTDGQTLTADVCGTDTSGTSSSRSLSLIVNTAKNNWSSRRARKTDISGTP